MHCSNFDFLLISNLIKFLLSQEKNILSSSQEVIKFLVKKFFDGQTPNHKVLLNISIEGKIEIVEEYTG